jgi:hypothetical protein
VERVNCRSRGLQSFSLLTNSVGSFSAQSVESFCEMEGRTHRAGCGGEAMSRATRNEMAGFETGAWIYLIGGS